MSNLSWSSGQTHQTGCDNLNSSGGGQGGLTWYIGCDNHFSGPNLSHWNWRTSSKTLKTTITLKMTTLWWPNSSLQMWQLHSNTGHIQSHILQSLCEVSSRSPESHFCEHFLTWVCYIIIIHLLGYKYNSVEILSTEDTSRILMGMPLNYYEHNHKVIWL